MKSNEHLIKNSFGVYPKAPKHFNAHLSSVACFINFENEILFLQKAPTHWCENHWGIPCGRVELNEDIFLAMIRELKEEIGFQFQKDQLKYLGKLFIIQNDSKHNIHHVFYHKIVNKIDVILSDEHSNYKWLKKDEIFSVKLIPNQYNVLTTFKIFDL